MHSLDGLRHSCCVPTMHTCPCVAITPHTDMHAHMHTRKHTHAMHMHMLMHNHDHNHNDSQKL